VGVSPGQTAVCSRSGGSPPGFCSFKSAGQAFVNAGRFDFYRCVAIDSQDEELEGFLITS